MNAKPPLARPLLLCLTAGDTNTENSDRVEVRLMISEGIQVSERQ